MRRGFIAALFVALVVGVASFYGGQWWALESAKRQTALVVSMEAGAQDAATLYIVRQALASLRGGRPSDAQVVLVRYAKLKAASLGECAKSPQCSAWAGRFMPTSAELAEVAAMQERP